MEHRIMERFAALGADSPLRAQIAYRILAKARHTSRLVRVQRPIVRNGKTILTHLWVLPGRVKKTDTVVGNKAAYEQWKQEHSETIRDGRADARSGPAPRGKNRRPKTHRGALADKAHSGQRQVQGRHIRAGRDMADPDALDASLATTPRERRILDIINGISDKTVLRTAIDTGLVAADEGAHTLLREQLLGAYHMYNAKELSHHDENLDNMAESLGAPNGVSLEAIAETMGELDMMRPAYAARLANPCTGVGLLETTRTDSVQTVGLDRIVGMLEYTGDYLSHIAERQPELADECARMQAELDAMGGVEGLSEALGMMDTDTWDRYDDEAEARLTEELGRIYTFFGVGVFDELGQQETDYGAMDRMYRLHQESVGSPEREAVVMNLLLATDVIEASMLLDEMDAQRGNGTYKDTTHRYGADAERELRDSMPVLSPDALRNMQAVRDLMPVYGMPGEEPLNVARARSCALQYASETPAGQILMRDPSPYKDAVRAVMEAVLARAEGYTPPEHKEFTPADMNTLRRRHDVTGLKEMREDAFAHATGTLRTATDSEKKEVLARVRADRFNGITADGETKNAAAMEAETRAEYEARVLVTRGVYFKENSLSQEAFEARVAEEGGEVLTGYNGISYNGLCAASRQGARRVPKDLEQCGAGAMMGLGIYAAESPIKSMAYAASSAFSGEREPYDGTDRRTDDFRADGIVAIVRMTPGAKHGDFRDTDDARQANRNMGGDCDSVTCRAGAVINASTTKRLAANETCLTSADMMTDDIWIDAGERHRYHSRPSV